jgi:hypothetical protein
MDMAVKAALAGRKPAFAYFPNNERAFDQLRMTDSLATKERREHKDWK